MICLLVWFYPLASQFSVCCSSGFFPHVLNSYVPRVVPTCIQKHPRVCSVQRSCISIDGTACKIIFIYEDHKRFLSQDMWHINQTNIFCREPSWVVKMLPFHNRFRNANLEIWPCILWLSISRISLRLKSLITSGWKNCFRMTFMLGQDPFLTKW